MNTDDCGLKYILFIQTCLHNVNVVDPKKIIENSRSTLLVLMLTTTDFFFYQFTFVQVQTVFNITDLQKSYKKQKILALGVKYPALALFPVLYTKCNP